MFFLFLRLFSTVGTEPPAATGHQSAQSLLLSWAHETFWLPPATGKGCRLQLPDGPRLDYFCESLERMSSPKRKEELAPCGSPGFSPCQTCRANVWHWSLPAFRSSCSCWRSCLKAASHRWRTHRRGRWLLPALGLFGFPNGSNDASEAKNPSHLQRIAGSGEKTLGPRQTHLLHTCPPTGVLTF